RNNIPNPQFPQQPMGQQPRQQPQPVKPAPPGAMGPHLSDFQECQEDILKYCAKIPRDNDISMIECLQDAGEVEEDALGSACEHIVWEFKVNFTQDERFHRAAEHFCQDELSKQPFSECKSTQKEEKGESPASAVFAPNSNSNFALDPNPANR